MRFEDNIRSILITLLSQKNYARCALFYLRILSNLNERKFKPQKPIKISNDLPLILIAQPPRSGGTLVRNLFDNHENCCTFPHELSLVRQPNIWVRSLTHTTKSFKLLRDDWVVQWNVRGVDKNPDNLFMFSRKLQKKLFLESSGQNNKEIIGDYLKSFFQSWLNYSNNQTSAQYFVAFSPIPLKSINEIDGFFKAYPDGYRIQVIRNPLGWWASDGFASGKNSPTRQDPEEYTRRMWLSAVNVGLEANKKFPGRYILLDYDQLITEPEESLKSLCKSLKLNFSIELLCPSLNGVPRRSQSSYGNPVLNFDKSALDRWKAKLDHHDIEVITKLTSDLYKVAQSNCINTL